MAGNRLCDGDEEGDRRKMERGINIDHCRLVAEAKEKKRRQLNAASSPQHSASSQEVPASSIKSLQHSLGNKNEASSSEGSAEEEEAGGRDPFSLVNDTMRLRSYYSACALDSHRRVGSGQCRLSTIVNLSIMPTDKMSLGAVIKVNTKGDHVVGEVKMDSPAEMAGLEQGDVLVALGNMPIHGLSEEELRELTTLHEGSKLIVKFRHGANETAIRTRIVLYKKSESGNTESKDIFTSLYNSIVYGHQNGKRYIHENFETENKFLYRGEWEDGKMRRLRRKIYQIVCKLRYFPRIKAFSKWKDVTFDPDQYASDILDIQHRLKVAERRNSFFGQLNNLLDHLPILTDIMTPTSNGKRRKKKEKASDSPARKTLVAPVMALESLFSSLLPGEDVNASGGEGKKRFTPVPPSLSPDDIAQIPQRHLELPYSEEWAQSRYNSSVFCKDNTAWVNKWQEALTNAKVNSSTWTQLEEQDIVEARALVDEGRRRKAEVRVILSDLGIDTHESEVRAICAQESKQREKALDLELTSCALFDRRQRQDLSTLQAQLSSLEDAVSKLSVQDTHAP